MKKLMIALAAVTMAAGVQAATCNWKASNATGKYIYADSANKLLGGTAYVIWASETINQQYVLDNYADIAEMGGKNITIGTDGKVVTTTWSDTGAGDATRQWFLAIVNGDKVFVGSTGSADETIAEAGKNLSINVQTASKKDAFAAGSKFADKGAGWYSTSAVPEPTSGLLLLLGVAGLALRRRRA